MNLVKNITDMTKAAQKGAVTLAVIPTAAKNEALRKLARALIEHVDYIVRENSRDIVQSQRDRLSTAMIDRLTLNERRVRDMARGLLEIAKLKDPVGEILRAFKRPNGLLIKKVRVPIGVVGIIYESRPNVTADCLGLCLKSGNAVILKGGREARHSNKAIFTVLRQALEKTIIPRNAVQLIDSTDRKAVEIFLLQTQYVDLIVPRGGEGLIQFVTRKSRIPIIKHYKGVCHTYVSSRANLDQARKICMNAKVQRPGVCNAMETLLVDKKIAQRFLPGMLADFQKAGVEIRGCPRTRSIVKGNVKPATSRDWTEEYLDMILSVRVVDGLSSAIDHINTFGTKHSDAIVTESKKEAEEFLARVDSACVYVNASTRFTDGFQFGFGAEIGISTDKIHARGPMALEELTTYKYLIYGKGQIRS